MEFIFLSSLFIKIGAEELSFNFLNMPKHSYNKTEVYLENYFSWHEPTNSPLYSSDQTIFKNNHNHHHNYNHLLIDTTTSINTLAHNLVNNLKPLTNSSDLIISNLSTILSNSSSNYLSNLTNSNQSSNLLNLTNLTDLTLLNSNLSSNSSDDLKDLTSSSTDSSVTLYDVPLHLILLLAFAYGMVSLTAVVGNSIVLWFVVRSRKLRTVTNIFIANLSIADILIGALSIPFQFQAALLQRWVLPSFLCSFCSFIQIVSVNVSIFTLTAIAADRYLVVFYPINKYRITKRFAKFIITFIWIFSVLAAVPALIALRVVYIPDLMNVTLNQELSSALLTSLASMNVNSSSLPDLFNSTSLFDERPTRPSNTLFWLDDLLPKIDLIENKDEKLRSILGNITIPKKPHCCNEGLSARDWRAYNLFLVLIQYFIPLIVITFAYTKMGLKLRETDRTMNKRSNKMLQRINTASSQGFSSSSTVRTTNNNLIVSPGTANNNLQMAIELQQTGNQAAANQLMNSANKRCRSLDCSPLEEPICLMHHMNDQRKCSQSGRHSPQCLNCQHVQQNQSPQHQVGSANVSIRSKHSRNSCTECCRDLVIANNNNDCILNKNLPANFNTSSIKKVNCVHHNCTHHSLHRNVQSPCHHANGPQQQYPPLQHHSSLQPTGSIHSNLMMPIISHPIAALRVNPHAEYIVINKKKVKQTSDQLFERALAFQSRLEILINFNEI